MAWKTLLQQNFNLPALIYRAIHIIYIAVIFEFIAWWLGRLIERLTAPLLGIDADREHTWRMRRRATLRKTPKTLARTLCYVVAGIVICDAFGIPVLPLSIAVGAVVAILGAALLPQLRDMTQGYALLGEDVLAVGDLVEVDGCQGTVEKFTLRGLRLRDRAGHSHHFSNRDVLHVVVIHRREGDPKQNI